LSTQTQQAPLGPAPTAPRGAFRTKAGQLATGRYTSVVVALVGMIIYLSLTQDSFMTWANWENLFRSQAVIMIVGIGATLVVLTAGLDLSAASITIAAGMAAGLLLEGGSSALVAVLGGIGAGTVLGLVNGLLIGKARISFLVVTLGTLSVYQSVALLLNDGETITLFETPGFAPIGEVVNGSVVGLPTILVITVALYLAVGLALHYTAFGRAIYATGSNPEAARLVGINLSRLYVIVYSLSGLFAGIGGVVFVARLSAAGPQADPNLLLSVLAAVLIGGTAYTGGAGGVLGTFIGALFLGVIQNGLQLGSVSTFWQGAISGGVLIVAVGLGVLREYAWWQRVRRRPKEQR
jgi:ribose transport system permease protein